MNLIPPTPNVRQVESGNPVFDSVADWENGEWAQFSPALGFPAPFCRLGTTLAWFQAHPNKTPVIFRLSAKDGPVALLPLHRSPENRILRAAADEVVDYHELPAESDADALDLLGRVVEFSSRAVHTLEFAKISEQSTLFRALEAPSLRKSAWVIRRYWSDCPVTEFSGLDEKPFRSCLSKNKKESFRKATKRLRDEFPEYTSEHLEAGEIPEPDLQAIAALHGDNQHRKDGESVFSDPRFVDFLRRQTSNGSDLILSLLWEKPGGSLMAFALGYFADDTYYYYIPSYEEKYAHASPGFWLMVDALRHCSESVGGSTLRFDMLSGAEAYKGRWADDSYRIFRYQVIPKSFRNLPRFLGYSAFYGLKTLKNKWRGIE